jgi:hypothetical protein
LRGISRPRCRVQGDTVLRELRGGAGGGASRPENARGLINQSVECPRDDRRKKIVARTFSMDTILEPSSLLSRAKKAASKSGVTLIGDKQSALMPGSLPPLAL